MTSPDQADPDGEPARPDARTPEPRTEAEHGTAGDPPSGDRDGGESATDDPRRWWPGNHPRTPGDQLGKLSGTVTGTDCQVSTLSMVGAEVQIDGEHTDAMLRTHADGQYAYWMSIGNNPAG